MPQLDRPLSNPSGIHPPVGRYHHLARTSAGELLFLAGQVAVKSDGNIIGKGNARDQTVQVYHNIGAILQSVGASYDNIVQLTTYVVGRHSVQPYLDARSELFEEIFSDGKYPPNTLLVVDGLLDEDMLIEVTAIAVLS